MKMRIVFIWLCAFLFPSFLSYGQMEEIKAKLMEALKNKVGETEETEKTDDGKEEEEKGYAKLLEGFTTQQGIFKVHVKEDKVYCPSYNGFEKNKNGEYGWTYSTISKILKNKVYLGHTEYGKVVILSYKSKKVKQIPRDEWKIAFNTHKSIISDELFDRVQHRLELNKRCKTHTHNWVLNGMVFCNECGEPMQLKVRYRKDKKTISSMRLYCSSILHKKGYCIRQYKGISLQTITQIVIYTLNQKVKNIVSCDNIAEFLEKNYKNLGFLEYEQEHNELKRRLEKTNKIIASLYNDYKNNILQEYDFKKMYNQEIEKREKINEQIEKINQKIQNKQNISNKVNFYVSK